MRASARPAPVPTFHPVEHRQLSLFPARRELRNTGPVPPPPDPRMASYCDEVLRDHAARHGWSSRLTNTVGLSIQALQAYQDTPGATISRSEACTLLSQRGLTVDSTLEVLAAAGLLDDDKPPAVRRYFERRIAGLPTAMTCQLETWYTVMNEGSSRPPRRRPRHHRTIHLRIQGMAPVLHAWAGAGHRTLAGIDRNDVLAALPDGRVERLHAGAGLRSLFDVLRGRKEVFTNPTKGIDFGAAGENIPVPIDTDTIRDALNSTDPARALAVALVAFHGLTARQISRVLLTDVHDGRLTVADHTVLLASPVRARLTAYLDYRERRFPSTRNPYLLVNRRSAPRQMPVSSTYPWRRHVVDSRRLREDRILHEVHATGGDVRRLCDLFGLSVTAATRYTLALEHPDLARTRP